MYGNIAMYCSYYYRLFVVPGPPRLFDAVPVSSSSVNLRWDPPDIINGVLTQYSLHLNGTNTANISSNKLMYTIEGLSPDTVYVLQLRAHTGAGAGPPSNQTVLTRKQLSIFVPYLFYVQCAVVSSTLKNQ